MILLQVGQAGIQSGQMLIDKLASENNSEMFLHYPFNTLDQLCIDTERKVCTAAQISYGDRYGVGLEESAEQSRKRNCFQRASH